MPLSPGTCLGPYEVLAPLGAGGMGEVYRARDRKLGRDVALKVLPAAFAGDAERMARFQREAQVLASLNHPNIAAIYGLEESNGTRALVMELVEGPTLADRIQQGPVPPDEALPIARQMAEALEYAHEKGIVHRDLKPANVKVTADGNVKVLDFGLAKALADSPEAADIANSPTLSIAATKAGIILGTAAYMPPEQAKGKTVDRRADIWAFGVLLYEMLTGRQLYSGETASETLAVVITKEPDWDALPPATPVKMRELLARCLKKDPKSRLRDIGEARIAMHEYLADPAAASAPISVLAPAPQLPWVWPLPWVVAGVLAVALVVSLAGLWRATRPVSQPLMRFSVELGPEAALGSFFGASAILSPDGTRLVFSARGSDGKSRLHTRLLDQPQAAPLSGTENARDPFFSPDGQWVGFFAAGKLKKTSVQGGAAVILCAAPDGRGGSWGEDGNIIAALSTRGGLSRVSSAGGTPGPVTELNKEKSELTHRWPQVLPGAKAVLFTAGNDIAVFDEANIEVQSLKTGQRKTLQRGGLYGRYLPSGPGSLLGSGSAGTGHLVYVHQSTLFAAPLDLDRLELTGPPAPVLEEVASNPTTGGAQFDCSQTGAFVCLTGKAAGQKWSVLWLDSSGKTQPLRATPGIYWAPRFSPDGKRLAMGVLEGASVDLWVYEWERDTMSRLTFAPGNGAWPVWTPDGKHIVFNSNYGGPGNIYWIRADGAGEAQRLTESKNLQLPQSFSPDGRRLAFFEQSPETGYDIWTLPLEGNDPEHPKPGKPEPFLRTPFTEASPVFSPDGRWLAYRSNESGTSEVYVRPFPGPGGKWQVSTGGGMIPVWSRNGRELFYRTQDSRIMVATYSSKGDAFVPDKPRLWSEKQFTDTAPWPNFDLAPDGKRFAVMMAAEGTGEKAPTHLTFFLNFFDELRRRAPAR